MKLILASQSPRRKELLGLFHIPFEIRVADIDETMDPNGAPFEEVARVSRCKALAIAREKEWKSRVLQIALLSGVGGFLVQAMTDYSFYNYRVMFLFWAYLALGALSARRSELPEGRLWV